MIMSRDTDVDIVRRSCLNFRLKTAEIVGSVFYGANFRKQFSFSARFCRSSPG